MMAARTQVDAPPVIPEPVAPKPPRSNPARTEIRTVRAEDAPMIREFLNIHWRRGHAACDPAIFDWQYAGFGRRRGAGSRILCVDGELAGFLGGIPGSYIIDGRDADGVAYAIWIVRPEFRDRGMGIHMMRSLDTEFEVGCCLGLNDAVRPIYQYFGYAYCPRLNRYISILDEPACAALHRPPTLRNESCLAEPPSAPARNTAQTSVESTAINSAALADLFDRTVFRSIRFGLRRTAEFFEWRYARSEGYHYSQFGDPDAEGAIVGRVERCICPDRPALHGAAVLRLIELLPNSLDAWRGGEVPSFQKLLRKTLAWARETGCILADFQISTRRLDELLCETGFEPQSEAASTTVRNIPTLFQPVRSVPAINLAWKACSASYFSADDVYFVKSDGDMDRPNIWPLPSGLGECR